MNLSDAQEVAFSIGKQLACDAMWDGLRCNWLGETSDFFLGKVLSGYGTLGPNVYDGTAGVSLFLSQLYRVTQDPIIHQTALGAIRHALSRVEDIPVHLRFGFYTGHVGIAYAALESGRLLQHEETLSAGKTLMQEVLEYDLDGKCILDVMFGFGGAIPAVLSSKHYLEDEYLFDRLSLWGDALISSAQRGERGISWDTTGEMRVSLEDGSDTPAWLDGNSASQKPNLLGYAHGAGGIANALLELGAATGEQRFNTVAAEAISYENSWFEAEYNRWPDLRHYGKGKSKEATHVAWCHGASGIGLSRVRAWELTKNLKYKNDALQAMDITRDAINKRLHSNSNFCLCHGLAGDAELFLSDKVGFGKEGSILLKQVLDFGFHEYHKAQRPWPYGGGNCQASPSLMLGLAGTGYFYLRATDAENTPSVMLLRPSTK